MFRIKPSVKWKLQVIFNVAVVAVLGYLILV
jgi:hypothetical protein